MEATNMRKMVSFVVAASLAACGSVISPAPPHHGGSGSGSGSSTCTENCAGSFTLDPAGFIVQGDRWWTATSGPKLAGTIESSGGMLQAFVGTTSVGTAAIAGTSWSLELPAGTIAGGDTTISLRLTAAGAQPVEQAQVFALDDGKPAVTSDS